jgi:hypothetical protein
MARVAVGPKGAWDEGRMALEPVLKGRLLSALRPRDQKLEFGRALVKPRVDLLRASVFGSIVCPCLHQLPTPPFVSKPNVEQLNRAWQGLLAEAEVDHDPPDRLGFTGIQFGEEEWAVRFEQRLEVRVPRGESMAALLADLENSRLEEVVDPHAVEQELARRVAVEARDGESEDWETARTAVEADLTRAVTAVAIGGVYVGATAADGGAAAVRLGPHALAAHLDTGAESAVAALAQAHGLVGFRFSMDSWWAEDLISSREDPEIGAEIMEGYDDSWPWLVLASAVPASGVAAQAAGYAVAEAVLGALILLDQPPGDPWVRAVPWIAGGLSFAEDGRRAGSRGEDLILPPQPQRVDASVKLDNAENAQEIGRMEVAIDIAAHAEGPGGELLTRIVASAREDGREHRRNEGAVARGCRLAWLAIAAEAGSSRAILAEQAAEQMALAATGGKGGSVRDLMRAGAAWRTQEDLVWPQARRLGDGGDLPAYYAELIEEAVAGNEFLGTTGGGWSAVAAATSNRLLSTTQAVLFGLGAPGNQPAD